MRRALLGIVLVACSGSGPSARNDQVALGGEAAARVDGAPIPLSLVAKVAAEQHIAPSEALRRLVDDAISASGARARGLDHAEPALWQLTAARGRWIADQMMAEARAGGPPTKEEIEELTKLHRLEVDRPPGFRVVHALSFRPKNVADYPRAKELAEKLRQAVLPATDEADFLARAKAVPHDPDLQTRAESLPSFAADGSSLEGGGGMKEEFARGAATLTKAGETSGIVESSYGWHVIRLLEAVPERKMPYDARVAAFSEEAYLTRANTATRTRLAATAAGLQIEVSPSAESLMESLAVRRSGP